MAKILFNLLGREYATCITQKNIDLLHKQPSSRYGHVQYQKYIRKDSTENNLLTNKSGESVTQDTEN